MQSLGLGDDLKKAIEASGIKTLYDATREYFNWGWAKGGFTTKNENCTPCEVRQVWINKILPYGKSMKVRFLKDYKMENEGTIYFEAKMGDEIEVTVGHRIYPLLMNLCDSKKIEEIV